MYPEDPDGEDRDVVTEFRVSSDIQRNVCPECFVWDQDAQTLSFHALEVFAGQSVKFEVKYTDDSAVTSKFYFYVDVDPLIVPEEDAPKESDGDSPTESDGKVDEEGNSNETTEEGDDEVIDVSASEPVLTPE